MLSSSSKTDPWSGVLVKGTHDRLVANLSDIALRSGLGAAHKHLIWTKADPGERSMQWAKAVIETVQRGVPWPADKIGICLTSDYVGAEALMMELTGLLIRNFVDARLMRAQDILAERKATGSVEGSAILCPDFAIPEYMDSLREWDRKELTGFIMDQVRDDRPTFLFVGQGLTILKAKMPSAGDAIRSAFLVEGED